MDRKRPGMALETRRLRRVHQIKALGISSSRKQSTMYVLSMDTLLVPMAVFPIKSLVLGWIAMKPLTKPHPAPTPAGRQELRNVMQLPMPIIPFTPPL